MALPKVHLQKIEQLLQRFDLNASEIQIYVTGLQLGPSPIMQLAQQAGIKRVTAHAIVDKLIEQGLFLDTRRGKKRLVYPASSEALQALLEQKRFELEQVESQLEATKPLFAQIKQLAENFPQVRMFQGVEGINTVLLEVARDKKEVFVINDAHSFNTLIDEKTYHRSHQKRAEHKIKTNMIFPDGFKDFWHIEREDTYDIHIRTLPADQLVDGGIHIRGNKVALHCYKEGFVTTTIMENREITQIMLAMYNAMWRSAQDYMASFLIV